MVDFGVKVAGYMIDPGYMIEQYGVLSGEPRLSTWYG